VAYELWPAFEFLVFVCSLVPDSLAGSVQVFTREF
jgi:hypothetical protein